MTPNTASGLGIPGAIYLSQIVDLGLPAANHKEGELEIAIRALNAPVVLGVRSPLSHGPVYISTRILVTWAPTNTIAFVRDRPSGKSTATALFDSLQKMIKPTVGGPERVVFPSAVGSTAT